MRVPQRSGALRVVTDQDLMHHDWLRVQDDAGYQI